MNRSIPSWIIPLWLVVGLSDACTGTLLVAAPQFTLNLMQIPVLPVEPVYMRFIGAFVTGIGLTCLYPLCFRDPRARNRRLAVLMEATAIIRLSIALFSLGAILKGALVPAWISVPLTDSTFAVLQLLIVRKGWLRIDG